LNFDNYINHLFQKDYLDAIELVSKEILENSSESQLTLEHFELGTGNSKFKNILLIDSNNSGFKSKIEIFYEVFYEKIRKTINDNRNESIKIYNNLYFIDYLSAIDYKEFNLNIDSYMITIKINSVDYLVMIINNSKKLEIDESQLILKLKLIKHLFDSHLTSKKAEFYDKESDNLIHTKNTINDYFSKISNNLPGFVYQFQLNQDNTFSLPFTGEKIKDVFGVSREDAYLDINNVFNVIHPDDYKRVIFSIEESAKHLTVWKIQFRVVVNGNEEWVDGEARPELKPNGVILWNGYITLISDLIKLQQKIEESESYKNSILNAINSSVIVSVADTKGRITTVNKSFIEISKYSKEDIIGKDHNIVNSGYHPKEFWYEMWKVIRSGNSWRSEVKNKAKDGTYYWVDTVINPIFDSQNNIREFLSIRYDITSKKNAEIELIKLNKDLEKIVEERTVELRKAVYELDAKNDNLLNAQYELTNALKFKDQFLAIIAHDIKNTLTAISLSSDLIINYFDKMNREKIIAKSIDIKNTSILLSELLNEILIWSGSQSGNLEISIVKQDIVPMLLNLIKLYNLHNNSNFETNINLNTSYVLDFDFNIVNTVVRNLLSNAIKFSGENGKIKLYINQYIDYIEITVEDNGVGMTKEQVEILLDVNKSKTGIQNSNKKGTGFGINLCIELINKHNGEFIVESTPNVGTKITIVLPITFN